MEKSRAKGKLEGETLEITMRHDDMAKSDPRRSSTGYVKPLLYPVLRDVSRETETQSPELEPWGLFPSLTVTVTGVRVPVSSIIIEFKAHLMGCFHLPQVLLCSIKFRNYYFYLKRCTLTFEN